MTQALLFCYGWKPGDIGRIGSEPSHWPTTSGSVECKYCHRHIRYSDPPGEWVPV